MFPGWRYHPNGTALIVHDPDELAALGPEWADRPGGPPQVKGSAPADEQGLADSADAEPVEAPPPAPKRGRGRPPKVPNNTFLP